MSPFPKAIAEAQRQAAEQNAIELLDAAEALYRNLADSDERLLNISASHYMTAKQAAQEAYSAAQTLRYALSEDES